MDAITSEEPFVHFGTDPFYPYPLPELGKVTAKRLEALRSDVRQSCPKVPGVYGMIDRNQRLIYVGKSKSLRSRLLSYFLPVNAEDKQGRIVESARQIVWEIQPSEFAALLREQQLIRRWTPRWNVQGIPKRQRPVYLCLGRGPAATFYLSRLPVNDSVCEGPFHGAARMNRVVDVLNKFYRLRDCSSKQTMRFTDQLSLFDQEFRPGCLRYEIGNCLGPCVGGCSKASYQAQVRAATSFLNGETDAPLFDLERSMHQAAGNQQYELAQKLRDEHRALEYLYRKLTLLAESRRRCHFVYATQGPQAQSVWYLILRGEVKGALPAPHSPTTFAEYKPRLKQWQKMLENPLVDNPETHPYTLPLVAAWFRKNPQEFERTFEPLAAGKRYRAMARAS